MKQNTVNNDHNLMAQKQGSLRRKRGRPATNNAARERTRVQTLRGAFLELQKSLPAVPPDTKLSKLDVLVLATTYIGHLMKTLEESEKHTDDSHLDTANETQVKARGFLHPVKKWPMRSRLYQGIASSTSQLCGSEPAGSEGSSPSGSDEELPLVLP